MGQIRPPLLKLDAINFPPDMLHMRKAIYSKLLDQIVEFAIGQQKEEKLVEEMNRIGIKFMYFNIYFRLHMLTKRFNALMYTLHLPLLFGCIRFFKVRQLHSGTAKTRWTTLNVHQLDVVLSRFIVGNVLDEHL